MGTQTGRGDRTITGYLVNLLDYPRSAIARDVDFTNCPYGGHYNPYLAECIDCRFGPGCLWLDQNRSPDLAAASVEDLVGALEGAVAYFTESSQHRRECNCGTCLWLREARHFLHAGGRAGQVS